MIRPIIEDQLCYAVYHTQKQFNKMYSVALKEFGLTYPQYLVLLTLWEKDQQTLKEIGHTLSLDSGTLTPLVKRMEQNGYLKRQRLKEDERNLLVALTDKGISKKEAILSSVNGCLSYLSLSEEEYFHLLETIKNLGKELGGIHHEKSLRNTN